MRTVMILMILFWTWLITFVVLACNHGWHWFWCILPFVAVIALGLFYAMAYRENVIRCKHDIKVKVSENGVVQYCTKCNKWEEL